MIHIRQKLFPTFSIPLPVLEFSIYFRTWSDGQYYYIWFNTWEYHGLTQWEAKTAPSRPAEGK